MTRDLMPQSFWRWPRFPSLFDEDWDLPSVFEAQSSGVSISEDDDHVYIEAAVPGVDPDDVEVSYDKGVLWIKAEGKEEETDKEKKFYRRAARTFSYRMAVPGNIDDDAEPEATYKNGVMTVSFKKKEETKPKRIQIKKE